ncbi:MAG: hypothetical protein ACI8RD_013655 [Bacillariaceae sp.]|jgi:hypothetical protein
MNGTMIGQDFKKKIHVVLKSTYNVDLTAIRSLFVELFRKERSEFFFKWCTEYIVQKILLNQNIT